MSNAGRFRPPYHPAITDQMLRARQGLEASAELPKAPQLQPAWRYLLVAMLVLDWFGRFVLHLILGILLWTALACLMLIGGSGKRRC